MVLFIMLYVRVCVLVFVCVCVGGCRSGMRAFGGRCEHFRAFDAAGIHRTCEAKRALRWSAIGKIRCSLCVRIVV